eukprot:COSAG01_NODE_4876_length_4659_cov_67.563377_1_plen_488_part_10
MPTTQLPFFLSSDRASEVDSAGSRFRVKLNPPIGIPRAATHTRVFVQEASVVYSMKNVNSTNNTFQVQLGLPAPGSHHVFTLTIEEGLYDALDEIVESIAVKCIETGDVPGFTVSQTTASDIQRFQQDIFELVPDYTRSRVRSVSKRPGFGLLNGPDSPLMGLLGFVDTDASAVGRTDDYHIQIGPAGLRFVIAFFYQKDFTVVNGAAATAEEHTFEFLLNYGNYTADSLRIHINNILAANRNGLNQDSHYRSLTHRFVNSVPQGVDTTAPGFRNDNYDLSNIDFAKWPQFVSSAEDDFLQVSALTITESVGTVQVQMQFNNTDVSSGTCYIDRVRVLQSSPYTKSSPTGPFSVTFSTPIGAGSLGSEAILDQRATPTAPLTTATNASASAPVASSRWVEHIAGIDSQLASDAANIDRVNSLAIAAPGLASGVHMNGDVGACTLCRFPVTGSRGSVIQFVPINPIKSTYPLQGSTLSDINIELLDQNG